MRNDLEKKVRQRGTARGRKWLARLLSIALVLGACLATFPARAQATSGLSELTICDGTATNGYLPIYGFYADAYLRGQFVYPSDQLSSMNGGIIESMTFYADESSVSWGAARFKVYVEEVSEATISAFADSSVLTEVYDGSLSIAEGILTVTFSSGYRYNGGNLLVCIECVSPGAYKTSTWFGVEANGSSISSYNYYNLSAVDSGTQRNFLPKVTFTYSRPASGGYDFSDWLEPTRKKLHNAGAMGTEQVVEITGDFALSYDFMTYLQEHPQVTLKYHLVYGDVDTVITINSQNVIADPEILLYGPLWLNSHYGEAAADNASVSESGVYVVQHGDTLNLIAEKLHVTVDALVKKNGIKNRNLIHPGQILKY